MQDDIYHFSQAKLLDKASGACVRFRLGGVSKCVLISEQASMDCVPLERCPHFRGCYVQASMELGHEDVPLLGRCPCFEECYCRGIRQKGPHYPSTVSVSTWYLLQDIH